MYWVLNINGVLCLPPGFCLKMCMYVSHLKIVRWSIGCWLIPQMPTMSGFGWVKVEVRYLRQVSLMVDGIQTLESSSPAQEAEPGLEFWHSDISLSMSYPLYQTPTSLSPFLQSHSQSDLRSEDHVKPISWIRTQRCEGITKWSQASLASLRSMTEISEHNLLTTI